MKKIKRLLSLTLSVVLVLSAMPMIVMAVETAETIDPVVYYYNDFEDFTADGVILNDTHKYGTLRLDLLVKNSGEVKNYPKVRTGVDGTAFAYAGNSQSIYQIYGTWSQNKTGEGEMNTITDGKLSVFLKSDTVDRDGKGTDVKSSIAAPYGITLPSTSEDVSYTLNNDTFSVAGKTVTSITRGEKTGEYIIETAEELDKDIPYTITFNESVTDVYGATANGKVFTTEGNWDYDHVLYENTFDNGLDDVKTVADKGNYSVGFVTDNLTGTKKYHAERDVNGNKSVFLPVGASAEEIFRIDFDNPGTTDIIKMSFDFRAIDTTVYDHRDRGTSYISFNGKDKIVCYWQKPQNQNGAFYFKEYASNSYNGDKIKVLEPGEGHAYDIIFRYAGSAVWAAQFIDGEMVGVTKIEKQTTMPTSVSLYSTNYLDYLDNIKISKMTTTSFAIESMITPTEGNDYVEFYTTEPIEDRADKQANVTKLIKVAENGNVIPCTGYEVKTVCGSVDNNSRYLIKAYLSKTIEAEKIYSVSLAEGTKSYVANYAVNPLRNSAVSQMVERVIIVEPEIILYRDYENFADGNDFMNEETAHGTNTWEAYDGTSGYGLAVQGIDGTGVKFREKGVYSWTPFDEITSGKLHVTFTMQAKSDEELEEQDKNTTTPHENYVSINDNTSYYRFTTDHSDIKTYTTDNTVYGEVFDKDVHKIDLVFDFNAITDVQKCYVDGVLKYASGTDTDISSINKLDICLTEGIEYFDNFAVIYYPEYVSKHTYSVTKGEKDGNKLSVFLNSDITDSDAVNGEAYRAPYGVTLSDISPDSFEILDDDGFKTEITSVTMGKRNGEYILTLGDEIIGKGYKVTASGTDITGLVCNTNNNFAYAEDSNYVVVSGNKVYAKITNDGNEDISPLLIIANREADNRLKNAEVVRTYTVDGESVSAIPAGKAGTIELNDVLVGENYGIFMLKDLETIAPLNFNLVENSGSISLVTITEVVDLQNDIMRSYLNDSYENVSDYAVGTASYDKSKPVTLEWTASKDYPQYTVQISENSNMSDAYTIVTDENKCDVYNLKVGTHYFWRVINSGGIGIKVASDISSFETDGDASRCLNVEGLKNARDIGGWNTVDGKKVKQGMIYRSYCMDNNGSDLLTENGVDTLVNTIGIKTELDLRSEGTNTSSVLGESINYYRYGFNYNGDYLSGNKNAIKNVFNTLANPENYPVIVHCYAGADRTGVVTYLLNGLLGVSQEDLFRDYLITNFANIGSSRTLNNIKTIYVKTLDEYEGNTLSDRIYNYLNREVGVSTENLDFIRSYMIED